MRSGFVLAALALCFAVIAAPVADAKSSSKSSKLTAVLVASSNAPGAKGKATFQTSASGKSARTPSSRRHGSDDGGNSGSQGGSCSGAACSAPSTRQELEVEVEHVRRLAGTTLTVFVDGASVGNLTIGSLGSGELGLRSQRGQTVPAVQVGSQIEVRQGDGTLIVSGAFR
jgi:hypothetical protein